MTVTWASQLLLGRLRVSKFSDASGYSYVVVKAGLWLRARQSDVGEIPVTTTTRDVKNAPGTRA